MHAVIGAENPTGVPAKVIRGLSDEEITWKVEGTHTYQDLTRHSLAIMSQVIPLGLGVKGPGTGRTLGFWSPLLRLTAEYGHFFAAASDDDESLPGRLQYLAMPPLSCRNVRLQ